MAQTSDLIGVAAFDFDGTLVPGDSLRPYLTALLGRNRLVRRLVRSSVPMLREYAEEGRDGAKVALLTRTVAGVPLERAVAVGAHFGAALAQRVKPDLANRIQWHREQGHQLVLVSASLTLYLDEFGRRMGFHHVIATTLATAGVGPHAVLTGALAGPNVRGREKETRLREVIGDAPVELWAYGDSTGDREMLAMADHAYRVDGRRLTLRS